MLRVFIILLYAMIVTDAAHAVNLIGSGVSASVSAIEEGLDGSLDCYSGDVTYQNCENEDIFSSNDRCVLNSTNGNPDGTYLLECTTSGADIRLDVSGVDEGPNGKYISFKFRISTTPISDDPIFIRMWDVSENVVADIAFDGNDTDGLYGKIVSTYLSKHGEAIAAATDYWVQIRVKSGASSALEIWVTTDWETWGTSVSNTDTSAYGDVDILRIFTCEVSATPGTYYDTFTISNTFITDPTAD